MTHYDEQRKKFRAIRAEFGNDQVEFPEFEAIVKHAVERAFLDAKKEKTIDELLEMPEEDIRAAQIRLDKASNKANRLKIKHKGVEFPKEMKDWQQVLLHSAENGKYPANNWLEPNGVSCEPKAMYASMFRHLAEANCGSVKDKDSGLHPLLHLAARALMAYVRHKRGLVHTK